MCEIWSLDDEKKKQKKQKNCKKIVRTPLASGGVAGVDWRHLLRRRGPNIHPKY